MPSILSAPRSRSSLSVSKALCLSDDIDYVRSLEDKLIHFSKIEECDVRRNDFEIFVTGRLQEELAFTNSAAKSTADRLKLKNLDFVKAMDKSILKLSQSAQAQGWESHVISGFQPVPKGGNDIWPYVDMLIQFRLLVSNMERMLYRRTSTRTPITTECKHPHQCKEDKKNVIDSLFP